MEKQWWYFTIFTFILLLEFGHFGIYLKIEKRLLANLLANKKAIVPHFIFLKIIEIERKKAIKK